MEPTRIGVPDPRKLIDCGDWACAHCHCEGLAEVAGQLAECVCDPERVQLREVARLAENDMLAASTLWSDVTTPLRRSLARRSR